jgi:hypothetical protein
MAVLARILERTDRRVLVLVRAGSQGEAQARLDALMSSVVDCPDRYSGRVTMVCGDLTEPGLGLGLDPGAEREWIVEQATTVGELSRLAARRFNRRRPRLVSPRLYRAVLHRLMLARADPARRRRLKATEAYFPYFALDLRFDDRRARELLEPLGVRATPITRCFDTLMDFAEAANWGRAPISRVQTLRPTPPAAQVVRTAEAVA